VRPIHSSWLWSCLTCKRTAHIRQICHSSVYGSTQCLWANPLPIGQSLPYRVNPLRMVQSFPMGQSLVFCSIPCIKVNLMAVQSLLYVSHIVFGLIPSLLSNPWSMFKPLSMVQSLVHGSITSSWSISCLCMVQTLVYGWIPCQWANPRQMVRSFPMGNPLSFVQFLVYGSIPCQFNFLSMFHSLFCGSITSLWVNPLFMCGSNSCLCLNPLSMG
jgi:hypothetical protein